MHTKRILITQSNYIPWKGYFDAINRADVVVLYDEAQYTRRDWRNRNLIKTADGLKWLTIPVQVKGKFTQKVNEVEVSNADWPQKHLNTLRHVYRQSPHFEEVMDWISPLYHHAPSPLLSDINHYFLQAICDRLAIETPLRWSREFAFGGDKTEKLLAICQALGATHYLSGPAAKSYLAVEKFEAAGIALEWMEYEQYPVYPQLHGDFVHGVSVLDLLFCVGNEAKKYFL